MRLLRIIIWAGVVAAGTLYAQEVELQVELMNRVGTDTSRKGDLISARVFLPPAMQGDMVEGKVSNVKSGAKLGGQSVLTLSFETLRHGNSQIPISAQLKSATNSKGQADVDDEGRVLKRATSNVAKAAGGAGLGGLIGGLAGGGKGAAIGAAAGGALAIILIDVSADAPNITFLPGSKMVLSAKSRNNQSLTSLTPNAAGSAPAAVSTAAPTPTSTPSPAAAAAAPANAAANTQPPLTAVKSEFIPGEKVMLYDDFTDMAGDEPPPHWKVRGGTAELRKGEGVRQLTMTASRTDLTPNVTALPKNFTFELDLRMVGHGDAVEWRFPKKAGGEAMRLRLAVNYDKLSIFCADEHETLTSEQIPMDWKQPFKTAMWMQNGRLRFYVNGQRIFDANQIQFPDLVAPVAYITVPNDAKDANFVGIQFARLAESTPDFSQAIGASGRYVTHGILFDTDSDRIKTESAPVIKMIARGLESNPNLKLCIEGHTDSVGNEAHNLELSKRRAEAVRTVLIEQFQVEAARLTTAGLGASKPIDSNDTANGRAQNRRVEFVRQQ